MSAASTPAAAPVAPLDLSRPLRLHVVGVGGPGMSAIAIALAEMGHAVSGSDLREQPVLDRVRAAGRRRSTSATIPPSSTAATPSRRRRRSPTATSSCARPASTGIPTLRRAGMLASICAQARSVAVAGTHGKTTTTSMLMLILAEAGLAPSFIVGGDVTDAGTGAHWTGGEWLVVEADESDGTHLELPLHGTILTNVELDFLEHYGSFDGARRRLRPLPRPRSPGRRWCAPTTRVRRDLAARHGAVTYGLDAGADFRAVDVRVRRRVVPLRRRARRGRRALGEVALPLRGVHNVVNAIGAIAMATRARRAVRRRRRARWPASAASPGGSTSAASTAGRRSSTTTPTCPPRSPPSSPPPATAATAGGGSIVAFQPNRFNRIAEMWRDYADAFVGADVVVITEIYPSGTTPIPGVTGELIVNAVLDAHPRARVVWLPRRDDVVSFLAGEVGPGDVCISMGCGDIATLPEEILARRAAAAERRDGRCDRPRPTAADAAVGGRGGAEVLGPTPTRDEPLAPLTTYRVGGPAALFVRARSLDDLRRVAAAAPGLGAAGARRRPRLEPARRRRRASPGSPSASPTSPATSSCRRTASRARGRRHGGRRCRPAGARPADRGGRADRASSGPSACPARSAGRCG